MAANSHDQQRCGVEPSDETTPLLATETAPIAILDGTALQTNNDAGEQQQDDDNDEPLPRAQIFLLCYTSVVEPIAFFGIFPYINFMIEKVGNVPKEDVGFYSGLIESLFSATQMCVMIFWGKASDRYGRKPILVISLIGVSIATVLFGMSQSLWQMIVARCFAGVFAGTIVTVRTMLSENSTKTTQARAFSYFAFARNLGLFLGPLLGGVLERPAEKYTKLFGNIQFFHTYPYVLPSIVTAAISLSAALSTMFFVKETLHAHYDAKQSNETPMSTWQLLKHPGVRQVILISNYVILLAFTFTAVLPVYLYLPVPLGGVGFPPEGIAGATALIGASQATWLLLVFSPVHKRIGTGQILWYCAFVWPFFFASAILFNVMLKRGLDVLFWVSAPVTLVVGSGVAMSFTAVQLAINDIAPSHETLGTLNSIVLAIQSGLRAIAPALATSVYAAGVKYNILGGHLFWLLNVGLAFGLWGLLRILPDEVKGGGVSGKKQGQSGRV